MSANSPWVAAIFGLAGVALGATLNHFYSAEREEQSTLLQLRSEAYFRFLDGQAALQQMPAAGNASEEFQALERRYSEIVKEARLRIGVLGSAEQIHALTDYFLLDPPDTVCSRAWEKDVRIYMAMRQDLMPASEAGAVDEARLFFLLWDCLPPPLAKEIGIAG